MLNETKICFILCLSFLFFPSCSYLPKSVSGLTSSGPDEKSIQTLGNKKILGLFINPINEITRVAKPQPILDQILKICKSKPISIEVIADNFDEIEKQAYEIKSWANNVFVKIPVINSKGYFSGKLIQKLSYQGFNLNITAVYTVKQVNKIIKCLNFDIYKFL